MAIQNTNKSYNLLHLHTKNVGNSVENKVQDANILFNLCDLKGHQYYN